MGSYRRSTGNGRDLQRCRLYHEHGTNQPDADGAYPHIHVYYTGNGRWRAVWHERAPAGRDRSRRVDVSRPLYDAHHAVGAIRATGGSHVCLLQEKEVVLISTIEVPLCIYGQSN